MTQASKGRTRSSPSSIDFSSRILNDDSKSVTKKAKLSDQIIIEEEEKEENGIADKDDEEGEEGEEGGIELGEAEIEDATAVEGVDEGDEGVEDGGGEWEDVSTVEGGDMDAENTRDADRVDCAALPDCNLPVISTTDLAAVPLPVTATDTVTSPVPLSVPVPVPVHARSLEELPMNINKQKVVTSASDSMQDRTDTENDRTHAHDIPEDTNKSSDDDSDDERYIGLKYVHAFSSDGKDGKATAKILRKNFAPCLDRVTKQNKPIKKPKYSTASSDLASATTSCSTSDKCSLSASELQELKQMTAQLSFMIARQR